MVELNIGQKIRVYASVRDFCGVSPTIYIKDLVFDAIPLLSPAGCLDVSGIGIEFRLVSLSGSPECTYCAPGKVYSSWGTAYTDAEGLAYLDHIISEGDLASYQDASIAGTTVKVLACITYSKGQQVSVSRCSEVITVLPGLAPTHYISLSMGFVPPELITYFEGYISVISDNLMTYLSPLPNPWVYLKTTYDRVTNSFNLWLYLPATAVLYMSPGALQDLYDTITAWAPLVIGVMLILIAAFGPFGILADIVLLFAGLVILAWKVIDATAKQILAEIVATNLTIQIEQTNKEAAARNMAEEIWTKSAKTQSDCTTRLQTHRDILLAKLNGFLDQYAKYPLLVTELTKIKDTFIKNTNNILTEFKTIPYVATTCDAYFVRLNSEIGTSDVAINDALGRNINPAENYSIACKGWTNQAACETGGCYWYDSSCHQEEACWISNPLGGCILSANTGKTIVGVTIGLVLLGISYWLVTRKRAEVTSIYIGAKEAAAAEAGRAKAAYKAITAPTKPLSAPYPAVVTKVVSVVPVIPHRPFSTRYPYATSRKEERYNIPVRT